MAPRPQYDPILSAPRPQIDDPAAPGQQLGGFSGSSYGNIYNGYAGFPGRLADIKALPLLVSWMDAGLPIVTMTPPETP